MTKKELSEGIAIKEEKENGIFIYGSLFELGM